jgi:hypothetical protein
VLYSEIAQRYMPAPKVAFVRLVINGEDWGLYLNQQQFNREYLIDFFGEGGGARWDVPGSPNGRGGMEYLGEDVEPYRALYQIDTSDDPERWVDLIHLFRVLNETPSNELVEALSPLLDIDGALRFLALEVVFGNSDGYWSRASDYYNYQDPDGLFHVMPHDMNEAFAAVGAGPGAGGPGGGGPALLDPLVALDDAAKPLRSRLLAVPELRERYLSYVREIAQDELDWATLGPRVIELRSVIEEVVRADTRKLYNFDAFLAGFEEADNSLKNFSEQRRAFLLDAIPER